MQISKMSLRSAVVVPEKDAMTEQSTSQVEQPTASDLKIAVERVRSLRGVPSDISVFKYQSTLLNEVSRKVQTNLFLWGNNKLTLEITRFSIGHWVHKGPTSTKAMERGYGIRLVSYSADAVSMIGQVDCLVSRFANNEQSRCRDQLLL